MDIENSIVVVTGAGSGIGRALAVGFVEQGADHVVCTDLDLASVNETATQIGTKGSARCLDVADQQAIETLVAEVLYEHGRIDIFVSNAGYGRRGGIDLATDDWKQMMEVHAWSHLNAARAVIPSMLAEGGGYLLNTASAAGLLTQIDSGPYAMSKHAAVALAEWLAITYKNQGIGVSVLCPQAVRTNILGPKVSRAGSSNTRQAAQDGILEPEQVALNCFEAIREERFLVLPHGEVREYFQRKASDYDRWLQGMRRFRDRLLSAKSKANP